MATGNHIKWIFTVVRYGASRRIVDGEGSTAFASLRSAAPPAAPIPDAPQPIPQAVERSAPAPAPAQQPERAQARQAADQDTEVVEAARDDLPSPAEQQQQQQQQQQQEQQQQQQQQQEQAQAEQQPQQQQPAEISAPQPAPGPQADKNRGLNITPDMPAELQSRLLELLTARGGTVTEILNKDGTPADSASVLQVETSWFLHFYTAHIY